jgi:hypothetical protein
MGELSFYEESTPAITHPFEDNLINKGLLITKALLIAEDLLMAPPLKVCTF